MIERVGCSFLRIGRPEIRVQVAGPMLAGPKVDLGTGLLRVLVWLLLLTTFGCGGAAPRDVVFYATAPASTPKIGISPTATPRRRVTRVAVVSSPSEPAIAATPSNPAPPDQPGDSTNSADPRPNDPNPSTQIMSPTATPSALIVDASQTDTPILEADGSVPTAASGADSVTVTPLAVLGSPTSNPSQENSVTPSPVDVGTATTVAATTVTPTRAPSAIVGQVSEASGLFVTSDSSGARDYYTRDDTGWHRIHPVHRIWFASASDLLRAFPNRLLHQISRRLLTATATPVKS